MSNKKAPVEEEVQQEVIEPDYQEKWQRALAELENVRRRHEQEKQAAAKFGLEGFIEDLLPVVDNFYRATEHVPAEQESSPWVTGIQYIQKNLLDVLESQGVKEISAKDGDQFDSDKHEAIRTENVEEKGEDGTIMVINRGYLLHDRVIRPVQVTVKTYTTK